MTLKQHKLFFKTIFIIFEDDKIEPSFDSGMFGRITALSHNKLDLTGFETREKPTTVISLRGNQEEIFGKFNKTARNEISRTEKSEGWKFVSEDSNMGEAYNLYRNFEYKRGATPHSKSYFDTSVLFCGYFNNELLSGILVDTAGKQLRIRVIFSKRLAENDKEKGKLISNATRRVVWEICKWGKENNFESLDLAGVNFEDPKKKGISDFKMSFGGEIMIEYTYIYKTTIFALFEKLARLKAILMHRIYR